MQTYEFIARLTKEDSRARMAEQEKRLQNRIGRKPTRKEMRAFMLAELEAMFGRGHNGKDRKEDE